MTPNIFEIAGRVTALETKVDLVIKLTVAVALPVYVQFVQMIAQKMRGERRVR